MARRMIQRIRQNDRAMQFIRFGLNGIFVTAIQYGVYLLLRRHISVNAAYTVGYLVSFAVNFLMTSYFTFQSHPSLKRFLGFSGSHAVNYCVQIGALNLFIHLGMGAAVAPIPAILTAVVVQFTILRFVYSKS
jgi:putative flippase GtrA